MYSKRPQSLDVRCIMLLIMLLVSAWLHSHGKDNFDVCDVIISTTTTYSLFSFISYLHYRCVLPYPLVEGGGKLFKLIEFFLCFGIEQWMSRWRLWEHIIQLGDIGDDRLLVRFGGINIWNKTNKYFSLDWCHEIRAEDSLVTLKLALRKCIDYRGHKRTNIFYIYLVCSSCQAFTASHKRSKY